MTRAKSEYLSSQPGPIGRWRWRLMFVLALAGIGVAGYLSYAYLTQQAIICGQSQGCDIVAQSSYSRMLGIPIAVCGLLSYVILLALLLLQGRLGEDWGAYVPLALFGLSLIGVLFSAYLTYLELVVILAVCKWCMASAIIMTIFFMLSVFELKSAD
jgi:uncharacterized membrane protein